MTDIDKGKVDYQLTYNGQTQSVGPLIEIDGEGVHLLIIKEQSQTLIKEK